jgi:hypothetical protein
MARLTPVAPERCKTALSPVKKRRKNQNRRNATAKTPPTHSQRVTRLRVRMLMRETERRPSVGGDADFNRGVMDRHA